MFLRTDFVILASKMCAIVTNFYVYRFLELGLFYLTDTSPCYFSLRRVFLKSSFTLSLHG